MIYLIGGTMRSGKSTHANLLCKRAAIPWVSTDALRKIATVANSETVYIPSADPKVIERQAEDFYPVLEAFARSMHAVSRDYTIEGIAFLPRHVDRLRASMSVRAVFLGWSDVDLRTLDEHAGENDWLAGMDQAFRAELPELLKEHSAVLKRECAEYEIPFIDMSGDFTTRTRAAYELLMSDSSD